MNGMKDEKSVGPLGDSFDRSVRTLTGLPDVVRSSVANVPVITILDLTQMWIVQTFRQSDRREDQKGGAARDTIFLQYISAEGSMRIVVPPDVAQTIARQRDALSTKNRRKGARQAVETRRQKGIEPFQRKKK